MMREHLSGHIKLKIRQEYEKGIYVKSREKAEGGEVQEEEKNWKDQRQNHFGDEERPI